MKLHKWNDVKRTKLDASRLERVRQRVESELLVANLPELPRSGLIWGTSSFVVEFRPGWRKPKFVRRAKVVDADGDWSIPSVSRRNTEAFPVVQGNSLSLVPILVQWVS